MKIIDVRRALNLSHEHDIILPIKTSKKNRELWGRRGYNHEGSWSCFSFHFSTGHTCIVRGWSKGEVFLLEANFYDRTDWYVWKNNNWWRFRSKCEAEGAI